VKLRTIGVNAGLKLNEYGLYDRETDELIAAEDEGTIYESMGLRWIPPEIRENTGEIEAAREDRLPELVTLDQIKGDLHIHTNYSHAVDPLEHMVEKAISMGHQYIAITDHSKGLAIAKGLSEKRLAKLINEIEILDSEYPEVKIIKGTECDIKGDGSLDYSDETLSQLDFVIASVHTGFQNDEKKLTQRMIDAIHNPYVKAIGHPTGRLIQRRSPYALDLDSVFEVAAEQNVFLEINGSPSRLDLTDVNARRAKEMGVKLSLGSDAHSVPQMEFLPLCVAVASRGWLIQEDVVNTWELEKVLGYRK
jgi:DNA polymerase (family 10)